MAFDHSQRTDRWPTNAATLSMRQLPRFTVSDLLFHVRKLLANTSAQVDLDLALTSIEEVPAYARFWSRPKSPPTIGISINGMTVAVAGHDRPAFSAEDLVGLDVSQWPGGRSELARCRGHVEVSQVRAVPNRDIQYSHDCAIAVTVVAAAVSQLVASVGLVWHGSLVGLPSDRLPGIVQGLEEGQSPASLWLSSTPVSERGGRPAGLTTRGLYSLLGAEIEISDTDLPRSVALEIVMGFAERILCDGSLPAHGDRMSIGAGRSFLVRHLPRGNGSDIPALILVPDNELAVAGAA